MSLQESMPSLSALAVSRTVKTAHIEHVPYPGAIGKLTTGVTENGNKLYTGLVETFENGHPVIETDERKWSGILAEIEKQKRPF